MLRIHPPLRRCVYGPKPNQGYTGITENEGIGEDWLGKCRSTEAVAQLQVGTNPLKI